MAEPVAGHAYFDVETTVGITAWGPTVAEAFARAALGALALAIAPDGVHARESREVRAQGRSREDLLVAWVNECLYVHEIEGFAVARVEVLALEDGLVHGRLHGEPVDEGRHRVGTAVRAATPHQLSIAVQPGRSEIRLIVDV